jgi:hypothetical protein
MLNLTSGKPLVLHVYHPDRFIAMLRSDFPDLVVAQVLDFYSYLISKLAYADIDIIIITRDRMCSLEVSLHHDRMLYNQLYNER